MKQDLKKDYEEYITSDKWNSKRSEVFKLLGRKCQKCLSTKRLHVHHKTYIRFKEENIETDLTVLCSSCHNTYHRLHHRVSIESTDDFIKSETYVFKGVPKRKLSTEQRIQRHKEKQAIKKKHRDIKKENKKNKQVKNPERDKKVAELKKLLLCGKIENYQYLEQLRKL